MCQGLLVVVKGGGDMATGVAHRLYRVGMRVAITELPRPTVIRRPVAFASAGWLGEITVEGVSARLADNPVQALALLEAGIIPALVDPEARVVREWQPDVVVDAIIAKRNLGTCITDAPIVIALGPGFTASVDCHAVVETQRGHFLGRVITEGQAAPNTGIPGAVQGYTDERVIRALCAGTFRGERRIGDRVEAGQMVARVDGEPVVARISGVLRGLLADGLLVHAGMKVGDVDPRGVIEHCFTISDKARAVGGGVLEAILWLHRQREMTK